MEDKLSALFICQDKRKVFINSAYLRVICSVCLPAKIKDKLSTLFTCKDERQFLSYLLCLSVKIVEKLSALFVYLQR